MYVLHSHRRKSRTLLMLAAILLVLAGGVLLAKKLLHTETDLGPAPAAVVTQVKDKRPPPKPVDTPQYNFQLPGDWEPYQPAGAVASSRSWRNTAEDKGTQLLTIYLDAPVQEMAINRVLPVDIVDSRQLNVSGSLSENCTNFTTPTTQQTGQGKARAKWQNIEFICDIGNYVRQVAGIAVAGSINAAAMSGPQSGKHSVFITFNDTSSNPDYDTLNSVVESFHLK